MEYILIGYLNVHIYKYVYIYMYIRVYIYTHTQCLSVCAYFNQKGFLNA